MSEPIYTTKIYTPSTAIEAIAGYLHREAGTIAPVAVHPRGCSTCERAVELAKVLNLYVPPLYEDER